MFFRPLRGWAGRMGVGLSVVHKPRLHRRKVGGGRGGASLTGWCEARVHARHNGGGGPARAHTSAPTELVSVEPGFVHYPPHPLCGHRRPASCSFLSGSSRTSAFGGGRQVALATGRTIRPTHRRSGAQGTAKPPSTPRARGAFPARAYQPASRHRLQAGTARPQPHRPHAARAPRGPRRASSMGPMGLMGPMGAGPIPPHEEPRSPGAGFFPSLFDVCCCEPRRP